MMIIWDNWLLGGSLLFLIVLGPCYAFGLLKFFRNNFQWHLASTVGICATVSLTAVLVWFPRGLLLRPEQVVYDLAIIFLSAVPSMAFVGRVLDQDRKRLTREIRRLKTELIEKEIEITWLEIEQERV